MEFLSAEFWNQKYLDEKTGWDLGDISTPIKEYFDQIKDKDLSILIPGCGLGYEGEYLFKQGFKNVNLLDFSPVPIENFAKEHLLWR